MLDQNFVYRLLMGRLWVSPITWNVTDTSGEHVGDSFLTSNIICLWEDWTRRGRDANRFSKNGCTVGYIIRRHKEAAPIGNKFVSTSKFVLRFVRKSGRDLAYIYYSPLQKEKYFPGTFGDNNQDPYFLVGVYEFLENSQVVQIRHLPVTVIPENEFQDWESEKIRRQFEDEPETAEIDNPVQ
jgi:hypothetical protein